jgi:hypothetical protein
MCNIAFESGAPPLWIGRFSRRKEMDLIPVLPEEEDILARGLLNKVPVRREDLVYFRFNHDILRTALKFAFIISLFLFPLFTLNELPDTYKTKYYNPAKIINEKDFAKGVHTGTSLLRVTNNTMNFRSGDNYYKNHSPGRDIYFKLIIRKDGKETVVREFFLPIGETRTETKIPVETNVMLTATGNIYGNGNFKYYENFVYESKTDFTKPITTDFFKTDKSNLKPYDLEKFKNLK